MAELPDKYWSRLRGRHGVEVGGPSPMFASVFPVYRCVGSLDGVNFTGQTLWEDALQDGAAYRYYENKPGRQYICEATALDGILDCQYQFLLSSNCLEHVANPIKALIEWRRVVKRGAPLVLVLPRKESNFDRRRPVTGFDHFWADFTDDVGEDDLTHLDEILALHDLALDPPAGTLEQFRERSLQNYTNRGLHHHVFDEPLIRRVLDATGFDVLDVTTTSSDYFALATKKAS